MVRSKKTWRPLLPAECTLGATCRALGVATLLVAAPWRTSGAQTSRGGAPEGRSVGVWSAVARDEPLRTRLGHTHDRDLYIVGVRAAWPLVGTNGKGGRVWLDYTMDLLPAVVSTRIPSYSGPVSSCAPDGGCTRSVGELRTSWRTVYGAGIAPLGLALRVGVGGPLDVVLRGSAGIVYFTRRVPDPAEERLNYSADVGAALELRVASRLALSAGWRLDHLSNGGRGPVNPSMNSRMLEVGTTLRGW